MIVRTKMPIYVKQGDMQSLIINGRAGTADSKGMMYWFSDQNNNVQVGFDKDVCFQTGMFSVTREIQDTEVSLREVEMQLRDMEVPEDIINELKNRL